MPDPFVQQTIRDLQLRPHPEGGFFREVYRSAEGVGSGKGPRSAATAIYFVLPEGTVSRFHRVLSDELWIYLDGAPLSLHLLDAALESATEAVVGCMDTASASPLHAVPAGSWQAALSRGVYTLVTCIVAPGFEFEDFTMLEDEAETAARVRERYPALARFI